MTTPSTSRWWRCRSGWNGRRAGGAVALLSCAWLSGIAAGQDTDGVYGPRPEPMSPAVDVVDAESSSTAETPAALAAPDAGARIPQAAPTDSERLPLGGTAATDASAAGAPPAGAVSLVPQSTDLAPTLIALAGVIGLIVLLAAGLRLSRGGRGASIDTSRAPSGILEVLGRYPISGGATLLLLRAHRRILLISQSRASRLGGSTLTTLAEFEGPEEVAAVLAHARDARDESISARFSSLLAGFNAEHGTQERLVSGEVLVEQVPEEDGGVGALALEPPVVEVRRRAAGSLLRRRLDDMRAWEGQRA